ncbi:MAG: hypothetical protein Q8M15_02730 [Bacteroidota bacterium]|nr:hypothetical protein [Bacteroidota bacterium]
MIKYKNKYRIGSARLQNWDYGSDATYFITICTRKRKHFFGEIISDSSGKLTMHLDETGRLAGQYLTEIPKQFPFTELGNFVVMPNHVHMIFIFDKSGVGINQNVFQGDTVAPTETRLIASLQAPLPSILPPPLPLDLQSTGIYNPGGISGDKNPMINENISRIIRWYKGRSAFEIHKINVGFKWQGRFHDYIIRNYIEFENIRNYIINNPQNWKEDEFYS